MKLPDTPYIEIKVNEDPNYYDMKCNKCNAVWHMTTKKEIDAHVLEHKINSFKEKYEKSSNK